VSGNLPELGNGGGGGPPKPPGNGPKRDVAWTDPKDPRRTLNSAQNDAAERALARAKAIESRTTPALDRVVAETGGRLIKREERLKKTDSLKGKVLRIMQDKKSLSPDEATALINDAVRYTVGLNEGNYVEGVQKAQQALRDQGFEAVEDKYKYRWNEGGSYKGINTTWRDPESGMEFEVQYHTENSFWAKDDGTHDIYEEQRKHPEGSPEWNAGEAAQAEVFRNVPFPDNVEELRSFRGSFGGRS
jgi:hypothetical protein